MRCYLCGGGENDIFHLLLACPVTHMAMVEFNLLRLINKEIKPYVETYTA